LPFLFSWPAVSFSADTALFSVSWSLSIFSCSNLFSPRHLFFLSFGVPFLSAQRLFPKMEAFFFVSQRRPPPFCRCFAPLFSQGVLPPRVVSLLDCARFFLFFLVLHGRMLIKLSFSSGGPPEPSPLPPPFSCHKGSSGPFPRQTSFFFGRVFFCRGGSPAHESLRAGFLDLLFFPIPTHLSALCPSDA